MTRIALVVTDPAQYANDPDPDTPMIVDALAHRALHAKPVIWHDTDIDWTGFDLIVIRAPWDYPQRPADFEAWLHRAADCAPVLNEPEVIRWNMDKHYLQDLADHGVAVVPTTYHRSAASLATALGSTAPPNSHVVLKPTIGAGSRLAGLHRADDPAAMTLGEAILADGSTVMLQPEIPELSVGHEKAIYMIDGQLTHAIAKGALLSRGGGMLGPGYGEKSTLVDVDEQERAFARRVLEAVAAVTGRSMPLYARIDTVRSEQYGQLLLEAELFEPRLNFRFAPEAADVYAAAVQARAQAHQSPPSRS